MVYLVSIFFSEDDRVVLLLRIVVTLHHQRGADGGILRVASQKLPCFVACSSCRTSKDHTYIFVHFLFSLTISVRLVTMVSLHMVNIMLKFPTSYELFNFILELKAIRSVMSVILVEMAVPIAVAALGISF